MSTPQTEGWTRRRVLGGLTLAGAAGLLGLQPRPVDAEPPPETTTIRLTHDPGICLAPQYLAEELLRLEGFATVDYVEHPPGAIYSDLLATGAADVKLLGVVDLIPAVDAGRPIVVLAGAHVGCFELFGNARVPSIRDLKGRRVAISVQGSPEHVFISSVLAYIGLDPRKDVTWMTMQTTAEAMRVFIGGHADAFLGVPPQPQELRARNIGHVIINTAQDRPWSQYFCCMVGARREFVDRHPIATKRALRAILKAANVCALEPDRAAQLIVDKGYTPRYDYALQAIQEIPYNRWRDYDPEDTVRFFALRLYEVGMIKSSPQKILAQGTDWRFFNELKRELKG
jgi:NitT/TauT family transport system substrate-binding protein